MREFLQMGGYAPYVWTAYGITLAVIVINVWLALRRHTQALRDAARHVPEDDAARKPTVRKRS